MYGVEKEMQEKEYLLQKQWDTWSDEQFVYMKKWALEVADEIAFSFCGEDYDIYQEIINVRCKRFMQSVIMQSMLKR